MASLFCLEDTYDSALQCAWISHVATKGSKRWSQKLPSSQRLALGLDTLTSQLLSPFGSATCLSPDTVLQTPHHSPQTPVKSSSHEDYFYPTLNILHGPAVVFVILCEMYRVFAVWHGSGFQMLLASPLSTRTCTVPAEHSVKTLPTHPLLSVVVINFVLQQCNYWQHSYFQIMLASITISEWRAHSSGACTITYAFTSVLEDMHTCSHTQLFCLCGQGVPHMLLNVFPTFHCSFCS